VPVKFAEYERLKATLDVLKDPALLRQIRRGRRYFAAGGEGVSLEALFGEPLRPRRKRRR